MLELSHWWQVLDTNDHMTNTTGTNEQPYFGKSIQGNTCTYEQGTTTGLRRGLKTSDFYWDESRGGTPSTTGYTNTYAYNSQRDFLASASYGDGFTSNSQTWSYDDAGNRTSQSCAFDVLNRQTQCSGFTYTNDAVGNRTSRTNSSNVTQTYTWDAVNRLRNFNSISNCATGADGAKKCRLATPTSRCTAFTNFAGQLP